MLNIGSLELNKNGGNIVGKSNGGGSSSSMQVEVFLFIIIKQRASITSCRGNTASNGKPVTHLGLPRCVQKSSIRGLCRRSLTTLT